MKRAASSSALQSKSSRRAAAAVEAAITLSFVTLLAIGLIEYGRALMVEQILVNAAREGARHAAKPNATNVEVAKTVGGYLGTNGIVNNVTLSILDNANQAISLATVPSKSDIKVRVSVPNSDVSWGVMSLISSSRTFAAEVDIRRE